MMKKYRTGLVVGKFCPLHKGHEYVISTALEQCEQVVVLSYTSSNFPHCSAENRKMWLGMVGDDLRDNLIIRVLDPDINIFPDDDAPDDEHREFCARYLLNELDTTVQAVFTSEDYGQGFAEYLTRFFTNNFPTPLHVDHVTVDVDRNKFSVSGTSLRDGSADMKKFTSPTVRSSFIKKILFLGGESSGKTTICRQLALHFNTRCAEEFGRLWFYKRQSNLYYEDMEYIATRQIELENSRAFSMAVWDDSEYLFCDTSALTTYFYSKQWFDRVSPALEELYWSSFERYDRIYVCTPDFPMVQDGTRQDESFRQAGYQHVIDSFESAGVKYTLLSGSENERFKQVVKDLT